MAPGGRGLFEVSGEARARFTKTIGAVAFIGLMSLLLVTVPACARSLGHAAIPPAAIPPLADSQPLVKVYGA